jgi:hypothetical protein
MSNVTGIATAGVYAGAAHFDASAAKPVKPTAQNRPPEVISPKALVNLTDSEVAYTASLQTLRSTNKMMMGYLLNIKV